MTPVPGVATMISVVRRNSVVIALLPARYRVASAAAGRSAISREQEEERNAAPARELRLVAGEALDPRRALAERGQPESRALHSEHVLLDRPVLPDDAAAEPVELARARGEVVVDDPARARLVARAAGVVRGDHRMNHGEDQPTTRRKAVTAGREHGVEILDIVQRESGDHEIEAAHRRGEPLDRLAPRLARRPDERIPGGVDHPCRRVDPEVRAAAGVEQPAPDGRVAAAEVEHSQPAHVADRIQQRRLLHDEVRARRARMDGGAIALEQLVLVVKRSAHGAEDRSPQPAGTSKFACSPSSVWLVASWISTSTYSPGCARPAKFATLLWRVRPRKRLGSVRDAPSTSTSIVRPTKRCDRSRARRWTTSTRRCIRSTFSSCETGSSSSAASVPRRGEKMNVNAPS